MSEQAWSKEPWEASPSFKDFELSVPKIKFDVPPHILRNFRDEQGRRCRQYLADFHHDADAARAVACVNALAGVPKPEGIPALIEAGREIAKLAQSHVDDLSCYATEGGCLNCAMRQDTMDKWHDSLRACGIEP